MKLTSPTESIDHFLTKLTLVYLLERIKHEVHIEYNFTGEKKGIIVDVWDETTQTGYEIGKWTNEHKSKFKGYDVVNVPSVGVEAIPSRENNVQPLVVEHVMPYIVPDAPRKIPETPCKGVSPGVSIEHLQREIEALEDSTGGVWRKNNRYTYQYDHIGGWHWFVCIGHSNQAYNKVSWWVKDQNWMKVMLDKDRDKVTQWEMYRLLKEMLKGKGVEL